MTNRLATVHLTIQSVDDIVRVRHQARDMANQLGFGIADQTRLATAVSELARNAILYGGGGESEINDKSTDDFRIMRVVISDQGPGIENIQAAMRDGFSTGNGLGAGLPGCERLVDEFYIESNSQHGTKVWVEIHACI